MREKTRCEVDDPMSTQTLRTQIWSSSASVRPVEEKKIRSPSSPRSMMGIACPFSSWPGSSRPSTSYFIATPRDVDARHKAGHDAGVSLLRQFALVVLVVELGVHPVRRAVALERLGVFPGDEGVLHPIRDRRAAFGDVHAGVVDVLLARRAGFAARIVRAEPGGEPQGFLGGAEVLVEPARAARRRRHHADRLVIDPLDLV